MKLFLQLGLAAALVAAPALGIAQTETAATAEAAAEIAPVVDNAFIFSTLLFMIGGILVFWMAAGFAMLEAGLVRSKNVSMQATKNIALFSIASIMYWIIGYNLMYPGDAWSITGYVGTLFSPKSIAGDPDIATGYSAGSDFFFQLMFCATTASIVSGTLAERIKLWPFLAFTVILTGFLSDRGVVAVGRRLAVGTGLL